LIGFGLILMRHSQRLFFIANRDRPKPGGSSGH
jgi:hypothetical protein